MKTRKMNRINAMASTLLKGYGVRRSYRSCKWLDSITLAAALAAMFMLSAVKIAPITILIRSNNY